MPRNIISHVTFSLQEELHEVEWGSTFCNDCRNAVTNFLTTAEFNIPLAICLAIFPLSSQLSMVHTCRKHQEFSLHVYE